MKKGLLLSIVASTVIFAGGDIAPVEPAAAAPAADCSDFYGQVGAFYETNDFNTDVDDADDHGLFGKFDSKFNITATIGVEKEITNGIGFGAEVGGWTRPMEDTIAANNRIGGSTDRDGGQLAQLYLTASFGNTGIKFGRFALPSSLSPLLRTGGTAGLKDHTFEGVLVANTDIADTTIYGVWVAADVYRNTRVTFTNDAGDNSGAFAFGAQYKGIADTTLTAVGYFGSEMGAAAGDDLVAGILNVNTKVSGYSVAAEVAYKDNGSADAAVYAAAKVSGAIGMVNAWAAVSYTNENTVGSVAVYGSHGGLIGDSVDADFGQISVASTSFGGGVSAKLGFGTASLSANYTAYDNANDDKTTRVYVGYGFNVAGIDFGAQYKYQDTEVANVSTKSSRVRLKAQYKF